MTFDDVNMTHTSICNILTSGQESVEQTGVYVRMDMQKLFLVIFEVYIAIHLVFVVKSVIFNNFFFTDPLLYVHNVI